MSLLDCICCRRHGHRTAVVWDDLLAPSCLTYSVLVEKGCSVACYIRHSAWVSCGGTVGLYGNNCPDVLCALLGILAVPAAYVPVDLAQPAAMKEHMLRKLGIQCILIHYTFLEVMASFSGLSTMAVVACSNAPINIMPHYPPYGQKAGSIGALTKGGCPYSRAFDYL